MKLAIGFSPCPNDTFIFDALVNGEIDTEGIEFEPVLADVQTLNQWALEGKLPLSKISYGVLPLVVNTYMVLNSGGALGNGVGPLLISNKPLPAASVTETINNGTIAIPGTNTTAHLLFSLAFPHAKNKVFTVFNQIEQAVAGGEVTAGVIIHENRFTYQDKGLFKVLDLGEYWEDKIQVPIPLGGIVANRSLPQPLIEKVDRLINKSLIYAFAQQGTLSPYVQQHAQEMSEAVMRQHIDLYVNDFSLNLGETGRKAVYTLLKVYQQHHPNYQVPNGAIFVNN